LTSELKIKTNRANSRVSTGPRTRYGRARAARNALRHGLSLPVCSDPVLAEEVDALAREIAGRDANAERQEAARRIAEAQIDLRRVRQARHQLLSDALRNPYCESRAKVRAKVRLVRRLLRLNAPVSTATLEDMLSSRSQGDNKFALVLSQEAKRLKALDRYERRALSRRNFAVRFFDRVNACNYIKYNP
jgi:hypothetical protein